MKKVGTYTYGLILNYTNYPVRWLVSRVVGWLDGWLVGWLVGVKFGHDIKIT